MATPIPRKFYRYSVNGQTYYDVLPQQANIGGGSYTEVSDLNEINQAIAKYGAKNDAWSQNYVSTLQKGLQDVQSGVSPYVLNDKGLLATQQEVAAQKAQQDAIASGKVTNLGTKEAPLTVPKGTPNPATVTYQQSLAGPAGKVPGVQPVDPNVTPPKPEVAVNGIVQPTQSTQQKQTHTVVAGDTLSKIAQKYGVPISAISGYRSGNPNLIYPGEVLTIGGTLPQVPETNATGGQPGASGGDQKAQVEADLANKQAQMDALKKYGLGDTDQLSKDPQGNYIPKEVVDNDKALSDLGLGSATGTVSLDDVIKKVSAAFGIEGIDAELKKVDDQYAQDRFNLQDNPWISQGLLSKRLQLLEEKYLVKKNNLIDQLRLRGDMVSLAINSYFKEKELQQEKTFKALEVRNKQLNAQLEREADERNFEENKRRFGLEYALDQQKMAEDKRRFQLEYGLDQQKIVENRRQFDIDSTTKTTTQKPLTVDQAKARQFATTANNANQVLNSSTYQVGAIELPIPNAFKPAKRQEFEQAARAFVNAVLRRESGATITDDEFKNKYKELIPAAGDGSGVLNQKKLARNSAVASIQEAGKIETADNLSDDEAYELYLQINNQ